MTRGTERRTDNDVERCRRRPGCTGKRFHRGMCTIETPEAAGRRLADASLARVFGGRLP